MSLFVWKNIAADPKFPVVTNFSNYGGPIVIAVDIFNHGGIVGASLPQVGASLPPLVPAMRSLLCGQCLCALSAGGWVLYLANCPVSTCK